MTVPPGSGLLFDACIEGTPGLRAPLTGLPSAGVARGHSGPATLTPVGQFCLQPDQNKGTSLCYDDRHAEEET